MTVNGRNGHNGVNPLTAILNELTRSQLARLDRALDQAETTGQLQVDLGALINEVRNAPPPKFPLTADVSSAGMLGRETSAPVGSAEWKAEVSDGRLYELLLMGLNQDEAYEQADREWAQVVAMVAAGLSYADAWAAMRRRYGTADTGLLSPGLAEDDPGANGRARPVGRRGHKRRRLRSTEMDSDDDA